MCNRLLPAILLWAVCFISQMGCHHRMSIISQPDGAQVVQNGNVVGITPYEFSFWWFPFQSQSLSIKAKGHRTIVIPLEYPFYRLGPDITTFRFGRVFGFKANRHRIILIREKK